jgi:hypothetical protein
VEFVLPDVPVDDLLLARRRVEMPLPVRFHQWNRHRPVVRANLKRDFVVSVFHWLAALRHGGGKPLRIVRVLHGVAGQSSWNSGPKSLRKAAGHWLRRPSSGLLWPHPAT